MDAVNNDFIGKQKYLGLKGLIAFISLANTIIPFSLDMYLPAFPSMVKSLNTTPSLINLTLVIFTLFFAFSTLIFGPLSDKHGRKPILIAGIMFYLIGSLGCAYSPNIYVLILFRIIQASGAGGCISVSHATIKDCFKGKLKDKVLAVAQTVLIIAPMIAPIIGAFVLKHFAWSMIFNVLAVMGILFFIMLLFFTETLPPEDRTKTSTFQSLARIVSVCKSYNLSMMLILYSLINTVFMSYLTLASYIYINHFKLSPEQFSYFFALNACVGVLGPTIFIKARNKISAKDFSSLCFGIALLSGLLMLCFGHYSPFAFLLLLIPFNLSYCAVKPLSVSVMFEQEKKDAGSIASLINFSYNIFGCLGMFLASLPLKDNITGFGIIAVVCMSLTIILWTVLLKTQKHIEAIQ